LAEKVILIDNGWEFRICIKFFVALGEKYGWQHWLGDD
jgi:hypothetical protein